MHRSDRWRGRTGYRVETSCLKATEQVASKAREVPGTNSSHISIPWYPGEQEISRNLPLKSSCEEIGWTIGYCLQGNLLSLLNFAMFYYEDTYHARLWTVSLTLFCNNEVVSLMTCACTPGTESQKRKDVTQYTTVDTTRGLLQRANLTLKSKIIAGVLLLGKPPNTVTFHLYLTSIKSMIKQKSSALLNIGCRPCWQPGVTWS